MNKVSYRVVLKDDVKLTNIYTNEELMKQLEAESACKSLPEVDTRYASPVIFPKAPEDRPYIYSSIALSADGKMAFEDNKVGAFVAGKNFRDPAGASMDYWVLNVLRAYSDGMLIGANTLKNEPGIINYVKDEALNTQRREVLGKKEHPVNILVSLDGTDVPWDQESFDVDPADRFKLMITTSPEGYEYIKEHATKKTAFLGAFKTKEDVDAANFPEIFADFDTFPVLVTGEGKNPDTPLMLYALRKMGLQYLCAESPTYTAVLMKNQCLDEYFITYSMLYAGGRFTPGSFCPQSFCDHAHADLVSIGIHNSNFLYTRQKLVYGLKPEQK